jgi:hypothetical protein
MRRSKRLCILLAVSTILGCSGGAANRHSAREQPASIRDREVVICGDCADGFDFKSHKEILDDLSSNVYVAQLRRALYTQDILHQFESRAHYDNCDFDGSGRYIDSLLKVVDAQARIAQLMQSRRNASGAENAVKNAFFALGQALHIVQDFYAHTNYVELSTDGATQLSEIPVLTPWTAEGQARIRELQANGLISGFVFWGFPQTCPDGTPSHENLAKDTATTVSGAIEIANLSKMTRHEVAVYLAHKASQRAMDDVFTRWPILKNESGKYVAFAVLVDGRKGL